jgi:hypothetical protein
MRRLQDFLKVIVPSYSSKEPSQEESKEPSQKIIKELIRKKLNQQLEERGMIYFNHFVRLFSPPTIEHVKQLLRRCAAAILPKGHRGADLLVPVVLPTETPVEETSSPNSPLIILEGNQVYTLGLLLIQIKNSITLTSYLDVLGKLNPKFIWKKPSDSLIRLPTVCVLLSLRCKTETPSAELLKRRDNPTPVFIAENFSHMILPDYNMVKSEEWEKSRQESREEIRSALHTMLLERFPFDHDRYTLRRNWGFNIPISRSDDAFSSVSASASASASPSPSASPSASASASPSLLDPTDF